ncbi:hypothetical protein PUNSTDRAFT_56114 [Punctularia strigosozonata HHB-11173 SS5]|uniref:Uncharacterized protein n=1 Tax=Punctularia strigosozonata (strain HHB-11173) TaxID=741275 RepID=R7S1E4_PUNST|nr:uncharacterized protein PUNSTDRAFT_56114 [Punctularia strigosozonata HHB-11173 SS5]EIN03664.1 hypothetical protein PUNSTDRAFT_56114 [Punctularia strigosozonata HHB-11173 SS5]
MPKSFAAQGQPSTPSASGLPDSSQPQCLIRWRSCIKPCQDSDDDTSLSLCTNPSADVPAAWKFYHDG